MGLSGRWTLGIWNQPVTLPLKGLYLSGQQTIDTAFSKHTPACVVKGCSQTQVKSIPMSEGRVREDQLTALMGRCHQVSLLLSSRKHLAWYLVRAIISKNIPLPNLTQVYLSSLISYESQRFDGLNDANSQRPRLLSPLVCDLVFLALLSSVTRCKQNTLPHGRGRWRREHFTLERRYVSMNQNQSILSTWIWVMFCYFRATQENWALLFPWSHQHIKRNPHVFLKVGIWIL